MPLGLSPAAIGELSHTGGALICFMFASVGVSSERYGCVGPGVCQGDGNTEAEDSRRRWMRRRVAPAYAPMPEGHRNRAEKLLKLFKHALANIAAAYKRYKVLTRRGPVHINISRSNMLAHHTTVLTNIQWRGCSVSGCVKWPRAAKVNGRTLGMERQVF